MGELVNFVLLYGTIWDTAIGRKVNVIVLSVYEDGIETFFHYVELVACRQH